MSAETSHDVIARIRRDICQRRLALTPDEVGRRSVRICHRLMHFAELLKARRIACYFPDRGEADLRPLMHWIWQRRLPVYLPVLHPFRSGHLLFRPTWPDSWLKLNRYGIPEPMPSRHDDILEPVKLDVVLTPLVAFDQDCRRIGMGGGYYDRTFWKRARFRNWRRPQLVGVGYEFQRIRNICSRPWDVGLDNVVTEAAIY